MTPCLGGGGVAIQHEKSVESWAQPVELRPLGSKFNGVKIQSYTGVKWTFDGDTREMIDEIAGT